MNEEEEIIDEIQIRAAEAISLSAELTREFKRYREDLAKTAMQGILSSGNFLPAQKEFNLLIKTSFSIADIL